MEKYSKLLLISVVQRRVHFTQLFVLDAEMQRLLDTNEMCKYFLEQVKSILQTGDINVRYSLKLCFHLNFVIYITASSNLIFQKFLTSGK